VAGVPRTLGSQSHACVPHDAGATLYDARELFDAHNPRADGLLRSIASELPAAVATCAAAAAAELDPVRQAALLKVRAVASSTPPDGGMSWITTHRQRGLLHGSGDDGVWAQFTGTLEARRCRCQVY